MKKPIVYVFRGFARIEALTGFRASELIWLQTDEGPTQATLPKGGLFVDRLLPLVRPYSTEGMSISQPEAAMISLHLGDARSVLATEAPGLRDYTPEQKEAAVARAGAVGMYVAAQELGIPHGTIHRWIREN